jgi:hypothetical protein
VTSSFKDIVEIRDTLVDRFLESVPRIYVASVDGRILEISKLFVLPDRPFYYDQKDYLLNRNDNYECIDTWLWVVDHSKLVMQRERLNDFLDESGFEKAGKFWEHPRYIEYVKRLDGWSLCIEKATFPAGASKLSELWGNSPAVIKTNISKQIIAISETQGLAKSKVREMFPHLSVRQFDHFWRIAAETLPELSKPGRKS